MTTTTILETSVFHKNTTNDVVSTRINLVHQEILKVVVALKSHRGLISEKNVMARSWDNIKPAWVWNKALEWNKKIITAWEVLFILNLAREIPIIPGTSTMGNHPLQLDNFNRWSSIYL